MDKKTWQISDSIQCQLMTAEYLEEALDLIETAFFPYENVCRAIGLSSDPEAVLELRDLTRATAKDGVSVIAVDTNTNKIVGVALNIIQVRDNPAFENFAKSWKKDRSKYIVEIMTELDNLCNLFEHCQVDCLLELMFLGTSPECRGKGIAKKLAEISIEIGGDLAKGINVKKSVDGSELSLDFQPKIISSIFSSFITQRMGRQLGFEIAAEKSFDELEFQGRSLASVIGPETTKAMLVYKKL